MRRIKLFFAKIKAQKEKTRYLAGYDYAAGKLLRKESTPFQLSNLPFDIEPSETEQDPFDHGMMAAINDAIKYGLCKDDRD